MTLVELTLRALDSAEGLSPLQMRVLLAVARLGPCNLTHLARTLELSGPSASRVVDRLVDPGLLQRSAAVNSRREITLTLTVDGRRVLTRLRSRRRRAIAAVLDRMSPTERDALVLGSGGFARAHRAGSDDDVPSGAPW